MQDFVIRWDLLVPGGGFNTSFTELARMLLGKWRNSDNIPMYTLRLVKTSYMMPGGYFCAFRCRQGFIDC